MILFPIKVTISFELFEKEEESQVKLDEILNFLFENSFFLEDINIKLYKEAKLFVKDNQPKKFNKYIFKSLLLSIDDSNFDKNEILNKIKAKFNLFNKLKVINYYFEGSNNFLVVIKDFNFYAFDYKLILKKVEGTEDFIFEKIMQGIINEEIINKYNEGDFDRINEDLQILGMGQFKSDQEILGKLENNKLKSNYIFIRSLIDYINSAPSESLSKAFLNIVLNYSYLFDPDDEFWVNLTSKGEDYQIKILFILLNYVRGLTRRKFDNLILDWKRMIEFLKNNCNSSSSNFIDYCSKKLFLDQKDPLLLEKIQKLLEDNGAIKEYLGIDFAYSKKAGRLFLTMMTSNLRGFDLMKNILKNQLIEFNLPVDSQVLRVALNSGLIKINYCKTEEKKELKKRKKETLIIKANILEIQRSDMTEIAQIAWKKVSRRLNIIPMELDYLIFSIGTLLCNRFGKNCYCCPITDKCESWERRQVFEGSGVDWHEYGGFSYGKGKFDALWFRTENEDSTYNPNNNTKLYSIRTFEEDKDKINLKKFLKDYKRSRNN